MLRKNRSTWVNWFFYYYCEDVNSFIKKLSLVILFLYTSIAYAQIKVDGILTPQEWNIAAKGSSLNFDFGNCYFILQNDTVFFAFDIIADNTDNNPGTNPQVDRINIYMDANGDNIYNGEDYNFIAGSLNRSGGLVRTCASCKTKKSIDQSNGIYATRFGTSFLFQDYAHRIWELAIPLKALPQKVKIGFGGKIISVYPQFSTLMFMDKNSPAGFGSLLVVENSNVRVYQQKNTQALQQDGDKSQTITGKTILNDGGFETSFADGHKRIEYPSGYTIIAPDGRKSHVSYMSVPKFIPPSLPDANVNKWLESLNSSLMSLIVEWLNNDQNSIVNMTNGETGKNIYEIINRRCSVINHLNPYKK